MDNNLLKRGENEDFMSFHVRLYDNLEIYGIDSQEATDILNKEYGSNYSESKWRKDHAQYLKWKDYIQNKSLGDSELDKLTIKKLELQKERNKLSAEKSELNKWIREQARTENIYDKIEDAIGKLKPIKAPKLDIKDFNAKKTATIDLADSHYGAKGKILGFNGEIIAEYSVEIFEQRMWKLLEEAVKVINKENITHVTVLNLGDSVDGALHVNQLKAQQLGFADQVMGYADFISEWLNKLSEYVIVDYRSVLGNHSETRPFQSGRSDFSEENMERLIGWYVKTKLKNNERVIVYEAKSVIYFDLLGTKILCAHGQDERNLEASVKDYMMIYQVPVHVLRTGHLHHGHKKTIGMDGIRNIEFEQSPSICGINDYSVRLKKTANAGSLITIYEENYGKVCTYDVRF